VEDQDDTLVEAFKERIEQGRGQERLLRPNVTDKWIAELKGMIKVYRDEQVPSEEVKKYFIKLGVCPFRRAIEAEARS
jgi:threonyl-tRNA synthetase